MILNTRCFRLLTLIVSLMISSPLVFILVVQLSTILLQVHKNPSMYNDICDSAGKKEISIVSWNSRGLVTSLPYLHDLMKNNDIISLSEHWLHSNKLNTLADISNDFNMIARASKYSDASTLGYKRGQGGVALLWRKSLGGISPITTLIHDRICGIRMQDESGRVINILSIYLSAPGSADEFNIVIDELSEVVERMEEGSLTIVCGDYNGDVGHLGGPRSTRRPTPQGRKVMKFLNEFSLYPTNMSTDEGPTQHL